jgi:hypothetical protein
VSALPVEMLIEARKLVGRGWCQGVSAVADDGSPIAPWRSAAVCWSAAGALVAVWDRCRRPEQGDAVYVRAFEQAQLALVAVVRDSLKDWNDSPDRRQGEVVEAFTRAIELLAPAVPATGSRDHA